MVILKDYDQFQGLHWETGSLRNYLAYKGVRAPHTGRPYSEAMLLGISGGIVMGYYTFDYQGYDPMVHILTRNAFAPLDTIYRRLDIPTRVLQTSSPEIGEKNLLSELESGSAAIVYADMYSLPYNGLEIGEAMWAMLPILVYGFERDGDAVYIADRSRVPLSIKIEELASARGRTKKNKYRLLSHGVPDPDNLMEAVRDGLRDCIRYFTQPPPKGSKENFGFLAYKKWADLLLKPNLRGSWAKEFPSGRRMYAALKSAFNDIRIYGKDGGADRDLYAAFLDEASMILSKPGLQDIADQIRVSAVAWNDFADSLLPESVAVFKETRLLMLKKHRLFLEKGSASLEEMLEINHRLSKIQASISEASQISERQSKDMRIEIAERVMEIQDIEFAAIKNLESVIN
ncbi:MAG: BtrH N-terminal domain-containing protein [Anaerolineales bacterium]